MDNGTAQRSSAEQGWNKIIPWITNVIRPRVQVCMKYTIYSQSCIISHGMSIRATVSTDLILISSFLLFFSLRIFNPRLHFHIFRFSTNLGGIVWKLTSLWRDWQYSPADLQSRQLSADSVSGWDSCQAEYSYWARLETLIRVQFLILFIETLFFQRVRR